MKQQTHNAASQKIISAGHICLDITPVFPAAVSGQPIQDLLRPGKLLHMESADVHTGGSVANTGLALKLLGNDTVTRPSSSVM